MAQESKPVAATNVPGILRDAEVKMQKGLEVLSREFSMIRTGRAAPSLVEGIRADYYGAPTPLRQLAAINTPDPKMIVIQPWDVSVLPEIEKAVQKSDLGLVPFNDGKVIKISVPPLSTERRQELTKMAHKQAEEGRIAVRNVRHAAKEAIEKLQREKLIAEDEKFRGLDQLQKLTDKYQAQVDRILSAKEADLKVV